MIMQFDKNPKELLGERLGKNVKGKLNAIIYFLLARVFIGGISGVYTFTRGFKSGWLESDLKRDVKF